MQSNMNKIKPNPGKTRKALTLLCVAILISALVIVLEQLSQSSGLPQNVRGSLSMLMTVLKKVSVYALVASSMNLLNGFTGLFSLGQAGFMLMGAYTYAIFSIPAAERATVYKYYDCVVNISFPELLQNLLGGPGMVLGVIVSMLLAGAVAAFFAWLIGLPVLRLKSDYLAIATLGFAEIIRAIFSWGKLGPITNGSNPLKNYVRLSAFKIGGLDLSTFFAMAVSAVCIGVIVMLINSSYGRAFKAIREDEIAAEAMGISLFKHKQLSFCISSFFAGVGGALLAMFANTVQANNFKSAMTYEILLMVVLGGIGSISGSVIGSFLYVAASEWWLRGLDESPFLGINAPFLFRNGFRLVVFSVIIMFVVLFFRRGIMGDKELTDVFKSWRRRKKPKAEVEP